MTVWPMRISRLVPNATDAHTEYVILIAFPLQHLLHELVLMLRYTYRASLVGNLFWS